MNKKLISWLRSHRVAVLKGGWSKERPISLMTGAAVEAAFRRLKIPAIGIDVNPGFLKRIKSEGVQFCFIALHGEFGEDGAVQAFLDLLQVPYTGSDSMGSALAMNKDLSKKKFKKAGVPTPDWLTLTKEEFVSSKNKSLRRIQSFLAKGPLFIKPTDQGSAIGANRVDRSGQIGPALNQCFKVSEAALVERYVAGREITVGILGNKALPVVEIVPEHHFYDFHSKYAKGGSAHLVPAPIPAATARLAQKLSLKAFKSLRCSVYGRVDLLIDNNGRLSVLEVNTIPGMTKTSLLPDAAKAGGLPFDELVLEIVRLSLKARGVLK